MPTVRAKTASGIDAAERRARKLANRTGKWVTVLFRTTNPETGRKYWAYYTEVGPEKTNAPKVKLNRWIKADRVRVTRKNGKNVIEIKRTVKKKRRR